MIYNSSIFQLFHISKLFNLPTDITHLIYLHIINTSAKLIINKWYSYILIHNINICFIVNKIPLLYGTINNQNLNDIIPYYNLHDINFYKTLKICHKYLKPNISSKEWWLDFIHRGLNGYYFVNDYDDIIVINNNKLLLNILGCFQ